MKRFQLIIFVLFLAGNTIAQEWMLDFEKAKQVASEKNQMILLNFSGSDWCAPCIKMKKDYFQNEDFIQYSNENLILVNADFPRRRKNRLEKEQQQMNDALAEQYNRQGFFPLTLLFNSKGEIVQNWNGLPEISPADFLKGLKSFQKTKSELKSPSQGFIFNRSELLMGSHFEVKIVSDDKIAAEQVLSSAMDEIKRIENLISSWDANSQTSLINQNAGLQAVKVDKELFDLIERSIKVSYLTQGAFDISFGSIDDDLWLFDGSMKQLPDSITAKKSVRLINYKNIVLDTKNQSVFLKNKGMKIGFGAIGKGYAAERVKAMLQAQGIESGIVNAGGDIATWGNQPNGESWTVGIANPNSKNQAFSWLKLTNTAIVTSGNYEKFVEIDGKKYTHIIDPRTGFPCSGLKSVSIICNNAELADALATSVFIMGKEVGLDLINQMNGVEAVIIDDKDHIFSTQNIKLDAEKI